MLIKDIVPNFLKTEIHTLLTSDTFPWYWNEITIADYRSNVDENTFQFTHSFYKSPQEQSNYINVILPIIWFFEEKTNIKIKSIFRIKANLTTKLNTSEQDIERGIHKDKDEGKYISAIYYVNDSDGDTIIYKDGGVEAITPKANSLYYFKSNINHVGLFPKINKRRIIINFILEIE